MMKSLELAPLSQAQLDELDTFYRTTKDARLRTRSQMSLLAAEQNMSAPRIATLVLETDQTVRNWLKRYEAEGIEGLKRKPQPGPPEKVTLDYKARLLDGFSRWINQVQARRGMNITVVAVANKTARVIWALLAREEDYRVAA